MFNMFDLTGRNAVVVGGAGGIGQVIAQGIAAAGAHVAIASRNDESLERAKTEIKANTGFEVVCYTVDATSEESVKALADQAEKDFGKIDILICAQGVNKKFPTHEFPMDAFNEMLHVNVTGFMLCCKYFGLHMMKNHYGKIVLLSSVRGRIASRNAGNLGYCTSKGAVDMLTRQLAADFGQYGITVNAIGPTITETPMMTKLIEQRGGDSYRQSLAVDLPLKRMATPQDCVGSAVFLASAASDFITGNIIYPDGGLTCVG